MGFNVCVVYILCVVRVHVRTIFGSSGDSVTAMIPKRYAYHGRGRIRPTGASALLTLRIHGKVVYRRLCRNANQEFNIETHPKNRPTLFPTT